MGPIGHPTKLKSVKKQYKNKEEKNHKEFIYCLWGECWLEWVGGAFERLSCMNNKIVRKNTNVAA